MQFTNKENLPQVIYDSIVNDSYDIKELKQEVISTTQLINPPIIRQLLLRHASELQEDISENIWRLLGQAVHSVLERAVSKDRLVEERLFLDIDGLRLTGKFDIYEEDKVLQDYKITSCYKLIYMDEMDKDWENQMNVNAYLLRRHNFDVEHLRIITILRDWSKTKAKQDSNYPQLPIQVIEIPLWTREEQEKYIHDRILIHKGAELLKDEELKSCSAKERWAEETTYAVYKHENKTASKVEKSLVDAQSWIANCSNKKDPYRIEVRKGEDKKCRDYCQVAHHCHYWKKHYLKKGD